VNDWKAWIGRTSTSTAFLDPQQANRMAVTLDREPRFASQERWLAGAGVTPETPDGAAVGSGRARSLSGQGSASGADRGKGTQR